MTQHAVPRNAILFALAFDATDAEIDTAINSINAFFDRSGIAPTAIANGAVAGPAVIAGPTAPADTSGVEKDTAGLPWDERIHSSNRGKNADGTWRSRRGVDKATVSKVTAELLAVTSAVAPPPAAAVVAPPPAADLPLPPPPVAELPLPPPPAPANTEFTNLVTFIASNTRSDANPAGRLTPAWINTVLRASGVPSGDIQDLAHNPALAKSIHDYIVNALATS